MDTRLEQCIRLAGMAPGIVIIPIVIVLMVIALKWAGAAGWAGQTRELRRQMVSLSGTATKTRIDSHQLQHLPGPVEKYFRAVLVDGRKPVSIARFTHTGTINMADEKTGQDRWKHFRSRQLVTTTTPGFDWDARVALVPGFNVMVRDAFVAGEGILKASLLGLVPVASVRDRNELAAGELMRFLAEAAWYPTVLLPSISPAFRWEAMDGRSARGHFTHGAHSISMIWNFDRSGLIESVQADHRGRMVDGRLIPTPWIGRFWNYRLVDGMRIPLDAEVSWIIDGTPRPYWRGHLLTIDWD